MADENNVADFLGLDAAGDVANVGFERNVFIRLMSAFANARMSRRENLVPHLAQGCRRVTVAPAAVPGAVNENKRLFFRIHDHESCDVVEAPRIGRVCASEQAATSPLPRDSRPASTRRPF